MGRPWTRLLLPALLAGCWLGLAGPARAVFPPPVKDDGSDIVRADAIAAVGRDYNGDITARLTGG